jgi:hypothetical protein
MRISTEKARLTQEARLNKRPEALPLDGTHTTITWLPVHVTESVLPPLPHEKGALGSNRHRFVLGS